MISSPHIDTLIQAWRAAEWSELSSYAADAVPERDMYAWCASVEWMRSPVLYQSHGGYGRPDER